ADLVADGGADASHALDDDAAGRHVGVGEARHAERARAVADLDVGRAGRLRGLDGMLQQIEKLAHAALPISTPRKRAGAVPWPTDMSCIGSPLPQVRKPHMRKASGAQIASQPDQKRGVMPVYTGFFTSRPFLPFLISQPASHENWKFSRRSSMDQLRFVVMSTPSSVSAMSSSSVRGPSGSGSSETLIMRMMGGRA